MNKEELLSQLRDIHLPEDASWWPLALGWWVIIALILAIIIIFLIMRWQKSKLERMSRFALIELQALTNNETGSWTLELQTLLKRVAFVYCPKANLQSCSEQEWLSFLSLSGATVWSDESLKLFREFAYQNPNSFKDINREQVYQESALWIKNLPTFSRQKTSQQAKIKNKDLNKEVEHV